MICGCYIGKLGALITKKDDNFEQYRVKVTKKLKELKSEIKNGTLFE